MELKHFIDTQDYSKKELLDLIQLIRLIKSADKEGATPRLLPGASLGMLFEEPSTRTRISFEVGMTELGGQALYLKPGEIHLGVRESLGDTAQVISRYVDVIMARTLKHETMLELAKYATVPVINGLTDYNHPTQVVCDVLTMIEHAPEGKKTRRFQYHICGGCNQRSEFVDADMYEIGDAFHPRCPAKISGSPGMDDLGRGELQSIGRNREVDR